MAEDEYWEEYQHITESTSCSSASAIQCHKSQTLSETQIHTFFRFYACEFREMLKTCPQNCFTRWASTPEKDPHLATLSGFEHTWPPQNHCSVTKHVSHTAHEPEGTVSFANALQWPFEDSLFNVLACTTAPPTFRERRQKSSIRLKHSKMNNMLQKDNSATEKKLQRSCSKTSSKTSSWTRLFLSSIIWSSSCRHVTEVNRIQR